MFRTLAATGLFLVMGCSGTSHPTATTSTTSVKPTATAAATPASGQVQVKCECSQRENNLACRDVGSATVVVTWFEMAFPPPGTFDWDEFCFNKRSGFADASVCCDTIGSGDDKFYRGTVQP